MVIPWRFKHLQHSQLVSLKREERNPIILVKEDFLCMVSAGVFAIQRKFNLQVWKIESS